MVTINQYLNDLEERDYLNNPIIEKLVEIIRAQNSLANGYYHNPIYRHAREIIREICDWEVEE